MNLPACPRFVFSAKDRILYPPCHGCAMVVFGVVGEKEKFRAIGDDRRDEQNCCIMSKLCRTSRPIKSRGTFLRRGTYVPST